MKKSILLAVMAIAITIASFGQKAPGNAKERTDSVKTTAVTVDGVVLSTEELKEYAAAKKAGAVPLYVMPDWIIGTFTYLRTSKNPNITDVEMDALKAPLIPFIQAFQRMQQRQQQQQPKN